MKILLCQRLMIQRSENALKEVFMRTTVDQNNIAYYTNKHKETYSRNRAKRMEKGELTIRASRRKVFLSKMAAIRSGVTPGRLAGCFLRQSGKPSRGSHPLSDIWKHVRSLHSITCVLLSPLPNPRRKLRLSQANSLAGQHPRCSVCVFCVTLTASASSRLLCNCYIGGFLNRNSMGLQPESLEHYQLCSSYGFKLNLLTCLVLDLAAVTRGECLSESCCTSATRFLLIFMLERSV